MGPVMSRQKLSTVVRKTKTEANVDKERAQNISQSKFINFSNDSASESKAGLIPSIKYLSNYPTRLAWAAKFVEDYPKSRQLLNAILEYPDSPRHQVAQIYLVSTGVYQLDPDLAMAVDFMWNLSSNLETTAVPMKFGELVGALCSLYQNSGEVFSLMIKFLKSKGIILPNSVREFSENKENIGDIVERVAQFVFGCAIGLIAAFKGDSSTTLAEVNCLKMLATVKSVLREVLSIELPAPDRSERGSRTTPDRFWAHFMVATCHFLATILSFTIEKDKNAELEEAISLELIASLDSPTCGIIAFKDKYNLAV